MVAYGKLSQITFNPSPRKYEPMFPPTFNPNKPIRWCSYFGHFTTDDAPDKAGKGCKEHPHSKWRNQTAPIVGGGRRVLNRWCDQCCTYKPRDRFVKATGKQDVSTVCTDCIPPSNEVDPKVKQCETCRQTFALANFPAYTEGPKKRIRYRARCLTCYASQRPIIEHDPERDDAIWAGHMGGMSQDALARFHNVSRNYVRRTLMKRRDVAA